MRSKARGGESHYRRQKQGKRHNPVMTQGWKSRSNMGSSIMTGTVFSTGLTPPHAQKMARHKGKRSTREYELFIEGIICAANIIGIPGIDRLYAGGSAQNAAHSKSLIH